MIAIETIDRALRAFMQTRIPPAGMTEAAQQNYLMSVAALIHGEQPESPPANWPAQLFERVSMKTKGWAWPARDTWEACLTAAPGAGRPKASSGSVTRRDGTGLSQSDRFFAANVNASRSVGEHDLFGQRANRCLEAGLISRDVLIKYQRSVYFSKKSMYGREKAMAWAQKVSPALYAELFPKLAARAGMEYADDAGSRDEGEF